MALHHDNYGFIVGEKRFKELNGNVAQIDKTTKEILAVVKGIGIAKTDSDKQNTTQVATLNHLNNEQNQLIERINSELVTRPVIPQKATITQKDTPKSTPKSTAKKPSTKTLKARKIKAYSTTKTQNNHQTTQREKVIGKQTAKPITRNETTRSSVKQHSEQKFNTENRTQSIQSKTSTTQLMDKIGKITDIAQMPSMDNLSPEVDAIKEIGDVVQPAGKAFVAMGRGAGWLFKRKSKRDAYLPVEQSKQHIIENAHEREETRIFRLMLQKLKDKSLLGLLGNLLNALAQSLAGLKNKQQNHDCDDDFDGKKRKKKAGKDGFKKDKKKPLKPKASKAGIIAGALAAIGLGGLVAYEVLDNEPLEQTPKTTPPAKSVENKPPKQDKPSFIDKVVGIFVPTPAKPQTKQTKPSEQKSTPMRQMTTGAAIGGLGAMAINPMLAPVGMAIGGVIGGLGGVVVDKLTPFWERMTGRISQQSLNTAQTITTTNEIKKLDNHARHAGAVAYTNVLQEYSSVGKIEKENEINNDHINKHIQTDATAQETTKSNQSWFDTILGWVSAGVEWVSKGISGLIESGKSFLGSIVGSVSAGSGSSSGSVISGGSGKVLAGIMGRYNIVNGKNLADTGAGSGDHFDISIHSGGAGAGTDPDSILHLLQRKDGVTLRELMDSKKYTTSDAQKYGANRDGGKRKHKGIDFDKRAFFDKQDGELFVADGVEVIDIKQGNNPGGYGYYTLVTVKDPKNANKEVTIRLGHQNKTGVDKVIENWKGVGNNGQVLNSDDNPTLTNTTNVTNTTKNTNVVTTTKQSANQSVGVLNNSIQNAKINVKASSIDGFKYRHTKGVGDAKQKLQYTQYDQEMRQIYTIHGFSEAEQKILKAQIIAESGGNINAYNAKSKAFGLTQFIPSTAKAYGAKPGDSRSQIEAQAKFMRHLLKMYNNDWTLALAAYNAGPGNVKKYKGVPNFKETQVYIDKIYQFAEFVGFGAVANLQPKNTKTKAAVTNQPKLNTNPQLPQEPTTMMASVREPIYPSKPSKAVQSLQVPTSENRVPVHTVINSQIYT